MVIWAIENSLGEEIFVPKIPSYRITDVIKAIAPNINPQVKGIRPGEKIHEEMITISDGYSTVDRGPYYAITPNREFYIKRCLEENIAYKKTPNDFFYRSDLNKDFLSVQEIRDLIRAHVNKDFTF